MGCPPSFWSIMITAVPISRRRTKSEVSKLARKSLTSFIIVNAVEVSLDAAVSMAESMGFSRMRASTYAVKEPG